MIGTDGESAPWDSVLSIRLDDIYIYIEREREMITN